MQYPSLFTYVSNNQLNRFDPDGLLDFFIFTNSLFLNPYQKGVITIYTNKKYVKNLEQYNYLQDYNVFVDNLPHRP